MSGARYWVDFSRNELANARSWRVRVIVYGAMSTLFGCGWTVPLVAAAQWTVGNPGSVAGWVGLGVLAAVNVFCYGAGIWFFMRVRFWSAKVAHWTDAIPRWEAIAKREEAWR
jgi:hypothetical protein